MPSEPALKQELLITSDSSGSSGAVESSLSSRIEGDAVQKLRDQFSGPSRLQSAFSRHSAALAIVTIVLLNACCFAKSLHGYFFADDFVHVSYLFDVFNGHFGRLWENFTGNWMQASGTQFYRPFITLTLVLDYWLGSGRASFFHLSNVIYQTGCSVFLFLTCRRLLSQYEPLRATVAAFLAGALFSVYPLHSEVVNWVIGRVDSVCLCFFLCSSWLYLRYRQSGGVLSLAGSLIAFAVSLMSKEPAAILPPLLVLVELTRTPEPDKPALGWWQTCLRTLQATLPYWLMLGGYLIVRWMALGTMVGGYSGSVGEGFNQSIIERLFHQGSLQRIFFPFNAELFSPGDKLRKILPLIYASAIGCFVVRSILNRRLASGLKYPLLAAGWFLLSLLPVLQVFNITDTLQCSRFAYAATAPLCLLLAVLLVPLQSDRVAPAPVSSAMSWIPWRSGFSLSGLWWAVSILLSVSVFSIYIAMTLRNNLPWSRAANQVKSFRNQLESHCALLPKGRKLLLLNVPDRIQGAHMIYNGAMLAVLASPPLTKPCVNDKVLSFEPINYGDSNLVDPWRVRAELSRSDALYWWDMSSLKMVRLPLSKQDISPTNLSFNLQDTTGSDSSVTTRFLSPRLDLPALGCDFVECSVSVPRLPAGCVAYLQLFWTGDVTAGFKAANSVALSLNCDGASHTYRFPVSQYKTWLKERTISRVCVELNGRSVNGEPQRLDSAKLTTISFRGGSALVPRLQRSKESVRGNDGVQQLSGTACEFQFDCSSLPGVATARLELSRPNCWFEHYSGNLQDLELSKHSLRTIDFERASGNFELRPSDFPQSGFYQIRVAGLDNRGAVVGYTSTPINLQVSR
ncbi:MAG: hypothetical protein K2W95_02475 [Candidatus Obscuribacterales bacterium]|nr:hypothetical protein [Candidatus Obscuribacterales bacterium]